MFGLWIIGGFMIWHGVSSWVNNTDWDKAILDATDGFPPYGGIGGCGRAMDCPH